MALAPDPADKLDAKADGGFQTANTRFPGGLEEMLQFMERGGVLSSYEVEKMAKEYRRVAEASDDLKLRLEDFVEFDMGCPRCGYHA